MAKAGQLGLSPETVGADIQKDNVRVFRFVPDASDGARKVAAQTLDQDPAAKYAGAIVRIDDKSVSFLTREILVRFRPGVTASQIQALAHTLGLDSGRRVPWSPHIFLFEKPGAVGYELLDTLREIAGSGLAIYAEPNLVVTAVNMGVVTPTDYLWNAQTYLQTGGTGIGVDTAWHILQDQNAAKTFGSSDIVIAVMDEGVASTAATAQAPARALHPDLDGSVSSGDYKVSQFFDFNTLQADNSTPGLDSHGVLCAGVATALANNPVPNSAESEGIAGVAPNCRLMALHRPSPGHDVEYSQAYLWAAGFSPGLGWTGPAPPTKGADIISNSFLRFDDASGSMQSLYNTLTQQGRGGKGCVILFSAGNDSEDIHSVNPSVIYPNLIVVSATNTNDTWHAQSNYGAGVSICAPQGLMACDATGGNLANAPGSSSPTAPLIYSRSFGDTSASTALAAGVAALVLSACPDLTWDQVKKILEDTANPIDKAGGAYYDNNGDYSNKYGYGRIDAAAAVQKAVDYCSQSDTTPPGTVTNLQIKDAKILKREIGPIHPPPDPDDRCGTVPPPRPPLGSKRRKAALKRRSPH